MRTKKQEQSKTPSKQLEAETSICKICFGKIEENTIHNLLFSDTRICRKCFEQFEPVLNTFYIDKIECFHLFYYDDQVKEKLYQLKGCFDYELSQVFLDYFRAYLKVKFFGYTLIPAPSSFEADEERGFNHVVEIFKCLKMPMIRCIHKTENMKQSDLSSEERKNIVNILKIDDVDLSKRRILIVDDVYTTGSTVKGMIDLIKAKNPKKIKVLVMSKTRDQNAVVAR